MRTDAPTADSCKRLKLLNGCSLDAAHAFVGVTVKEETIQLTTADEVQANLPLSGIELAAGMDASSSLDLARHCGCLCDGARLLR